MPRFRLRLIGLVGQAPWPAAVEKTLLKSLCLSSIKVQARRWFTAQPAETWGGHNAPKACSPRSLSTKQAPSSGPLPRHDPTCTYVSNLPFNSNTTTTP